MIQIYFNSFFHFSLNCFIIFFLSLTLHVAYMKVNPATITEWEQSDFLNICVVAIFAEIV